MFQWEKEHLVGVRLWYQTGILAPEPVGPRIPGTEHVRKMMFLRPIEHIKICLLPPKEI